MLHREGLEETHVFTPCHGEPAEKRKPALKLTLHEWFLSAALLKTGVLFKCFVFIKEKNQFCFELTSLLDTQGIVHHVRRAQLLDGMSVECYRFPGHVGLPFS